MGYTLKELTDEQLISEFKAAYASYLGWQKCMDGSDGACWEYEVVPVIEEWISRGYSREDLFKHLEDK